MMENAGRALAHHARELADGPILVLADGGGNGGGGLCAARHLHNRGQPVTVVLDRDVDGLDGVTATQAHILRESAVPILDGDADVTDANTEAAIVVDALVGYGLEAAPRGRVRTLIRASQRADRRLSLDVPSGVDATTGSTPGVVVRPDRTVTLALPKTGLTERCGALFLADIGIPPAVYQRFDLGYEPPFAAADWVRIRPGPS